jgi:lysozyme family protein
MPSGVDDVVFDMAVNNGVVGAAKCAQIVAGKLTGKPITIDGHIGAISIDLIDDCDSAAFINAFCDKRLKTDAGFFNWKTFGKAWTNRVNGNKSLGITGVRTQGLSLIANDNRLADVAKPKMPETVLCVQAAPAQSWVDWLISLIANLFRRH